MRLTLRHRYLPADLDGALFVSPLREDAKYIYNAGGGIDAAAPATQVVDALGTFIHPATGLITPATANILRVGSGLDLEARLKGALFEGARTNSCLQSEDFANASWSKTRSSVAANDIAAPDGILTADKIVEDSTAGATHRLGQSITVTSGQKIVVSVFAKKAERSEFRLSPEGTAAPASVTVWFDLNAGTKGTVGAGVDNSGIDDMGNGWYRCWLVFTADASDTFNYQFYLGSGSETETYNGDGSSGLYLWGAQCEENVEYPGSYIKTTTVAVTVAADDIRFGNASEVNCKAAAGTIYIAQTPQFGGDQGEDHYLFDMLVSGAADGVRAYRSLADGYTRYRVRSGGADSAFIDDEFLLVRGTTYIWTFVWALNNFRIYRDGIEVVSDTDGAAPTAMNATIFIGQASGINSQPDSNFSHFHIYDSAHDAARVLANTKEIQSWLGI